MKKFLIFLSIVAVSFLGSDCTPANNLSLVKYPAGSSIVPIDYATARILIRRLKKIRERKKLIYKNEIDHKQLLKLLTEDPEKPISSVRLLFGSVQEMDAAGKKRMMLTTIIQIGRRSKLLHVRPTYEYYSIEPAVCPPPPLCIIEEQ